MLLLDDGGRCVDANAAACLFFRQPIELVRGLTVQELAAPAINPRLEAL